MKRLALTLTMLGAICAPALCYDDSSIDLSCTSIIVGSAASVDGSLYTSHTCDGHYRSWVTMEPSTPFPKGAMHDVKTQTYKTRFSTDTIGVKTVLQIPESGTTYKYLNSGYPCMNEYQLAMGETTFGGPDILRNPDAPFHIEELQRIAMQRCRSARSAIMMMGSLAEVYGYGDGGECITVIDKKEAWYFEIVGVGKKQKGAAWAAVRIPDDHVAVSANIPRIGKIDRSDFFNCMCSANVETVALRNGLWDGEGEFSFWRAFHGDYGDGHNYSYREYYILNALAPSLGLQYGADELPLSVKPDEKVDVKRIFELLRSTYEGSDWDVSKGMVVKDKDGKVKRSPIANPWITSETVNMLNTVKPGTAESHRTPAVIWCAYSQVVEVNADAPKGLGAICWYSVDNPAQSPHIPFFCGGTDLPEAYDYCGQFEYYPNCALWQFRRANRLATTKWTANKAEFEKTLLDVEAETFRQVDSLKKAYDGNAASLDKFTESAYNRAAAVWNGLEAKYWLDTWRGLF